MMSWLQTYVRALWTWRTGKYKLAIATYPASHCAWSKATWHLTGGWSAGLGMVWRAVWQQRVDAVGRCTVGVHGQLLSEGFLFTPVCKPVVDSHLCNQVRAEALSFGGGHASLETFRSAGNTLRKLEIEYTIKPAVILGGHSYCYVPPTCCTLLPDFPSPLCWGSSASHKPGRGSAVTQAPIWSGYVSFSWRRVRCRPLHRADPCPDQTGWTLGKKTPDPDCLCPSYCRRNLALPGWTLK